MNLAPGSRKGVAKISIFITSIFVIVLSISYAFINQTLTGTKKQVITAGNLELELKEENEITLENMLPMHDEVGMIQKSFDFTLTNKTDNDTNYALRLKDVTGEEQQKLDIAIVRYGLTKDGVVTKNYLSKLKDNVLDEGKIKGNQTIEYSLRLWIDSNVEDESLIEDKTLSYKIEVEMNQKIATIYPEVASELVGKNLGLNCKTYDDGVDTFLVGECSNNYVWYSGKLWRVVLKNNETGAVKMITDNAITAISYNTRDNIAFENSFADQWLNQEFLPTLHDYQDYLVVDSVWDNTLDSSDAPSRPAGVTQVQRTVGLLNAYEYYTTYNNSDGLATYKNGYLNNGAWWRLITPESTSYVWYAGEYGRLRKYDPSVSLAVRPSVNLQSAIHITEGSGIQTNPYRLENDSQETINGITLLSTRHSGEYITFNSKLYRIVGIEDSKTKITAVNTQSGLVGNRFHNNIYNQIANFARASIKTDLETYYQNNIVETYKSMIEPDTTWYLGKVDTNYKESICKTVNASESVTTCEKTDASTTASVGLPRIGEMFTSNITRGGEDSFWTLTPVGSSYVFGIQYFSEAIALGAYNIRDARPSMYLKPNVVISSTNTGDGTYEHPYDIELSE